MQNLPERPSVIAGEPLDLIREITGSEEQATIKVELRGRISDKYFATAKIHLSSASGERLNYDAIEQISLILTCVFNEPKDASSVDLLRPSNDYGLDLIACDYCDAHFATYATALEHERDEHPTN